MKYLLLCSLFICIVVTSLQAKLPTVDIIVRGLNDKQVQSKIFNYQHHNIDLIKIGESFQGYDGHVRFGAYFRMNYVARAGHSFRVKRDCQFVIAVPVINPDTRKVKIQGDNCGAPICPKEYIHSDSEGWYDPISGININYLPCIQKKDQAVCLNKRPDLENSQIMLPRGWYSKLTGELLKIDPHCGLY